LGYSIICHNTSLDDKDVVKRYYAKDTIERAFKHMKGVLSLSPEGVWVLSYVYAHMKICYLSYTILSMLQYHIERAGISGEDDLELLSGGYSMQLMDRGSGFNWSTNVEPSMK
jgi:transposase